MEKNNETHLDRWVEERLAAINPGAEWRPNATAGLARLKERRGAGSGRRLRWTWAAAMAMAGCLAVMALPSTRVFAERCIGACSDAGVRAGETLYSWHNSLFRFVHNLIRDAAPLAAKKMAPDFTLNDASGQPVKLSDFRGKVVLLNFWATWCQPCLVEIPWFVEFQQTYGDRDFVALGVSMDDDGWKSVKPFLDQNNVTYPVMLGNGDVAALYGGIEALPTTVIIDKNGRIASTHEGLVSKTDYSAEIEALLKK